MYCFPPTYDEPYACRQEARPKSAVEPGDEGVRNLRNTFEGDAQGNHECDDYVTLDTEGAEDGGAGLGHGHYALRIPANNSSEHEPETCKDHCRQKEIPPWNTLQALIIVNANQRYPCADSRPKETIDKKQVFGGNLQHLSAADPGETPAGRILNMVVGRVDSDQLIAVGY